jgi:hypothetical protein
MKKRAITIACSKSYLPQFMVLYESIRKFSNIPIIVQTTMKTSNKFPSDVTVYNYLKLKKRVKYKNDGTYLASCRPDIVLRAFKSGFSEVINMGCDMEFLSDFEEIWSHLQRFEAIVTPHITDLLPEDGKSPRNAQMHNTCHINSDFSVFKDTPQVRKVLEWISDKLSAECCADFERGLFFEQNYWGYLPYLTNCKILKDPRYNIAYWNYKQRGFRKTIITDFPSGDNPEETWVVDIGIPAILFHFSGLTDPKGISKHQNRYEATDDFLEFLKDYKKRIDK